MPVDVHRGLSTAVTALLMKEVLSDACLGANEKGLGCIPGHQRS